MILQKSVALICSIVSCGSAFYRPTLLLLPFWILPVGLQLHTEIAEDILASPVATSGLARRRMELLSTSFVH